MDRTDLKRPSWLYPLLFVCGLSAISFFWGLGQRDLWGADEMRYASTVREMIENGDWISPQYNRHDDGEKPPLFYWLGAITVKIRGHFDELATLIPSALGGALLLWFTLLLGQRLLGSPGGYYAAAMMATTIGFSWQSRIGQIDSLFAGLLMGSLHGFFASMEETGGRRVRYLLLGYVCLGLAWMAKGPASIVIVGIAGLAYFLFVREWRTPRAIWVGLRGLGLWWGIPLFLVLVVPWYLALGWHQPNGWDVVWRVLWTQNVERYANFWENKDSRSVFFQAFPDLLPWTLPFLVATVLAWKREEFHRRERRFCAIWFAGVFVFFFLGESRRTAYLIPIYPAATFLATSLWMQALRSGKEPLLNLVQAVGTWAATALSLLFVLYLGAQSMLPESMRFPYPLAVPSILVFLAFLLAGLWISLRALSRSQPARAFAALVAFLLAGAFVLFGFFIPAMDHYKSRKRTIEAFVAPVPSGVKLWTYRNERPWMVYYTPHRFAGYIEREDALEKALESGDCAIVSPPVLEEQRARLGEKLEVLSDLKEGKREKEKVKMHIVRQR